MTNQDFRAALLKKIQAELERAYRNQLNCATQREHSRYAGEISALKRMMVLVVTEGVGQ